MSETLIYHMCRADEWSAAEAAGSYGGSSQDQTDGFIHFSTAKQVRESATKHRAGQDGLVLLTVACDLLGRSLKWEPSRGDQLFPHLYGSLPVSAVQKSDPLPIGDNGLHIFPDHVPND